MMLTINKIDKYVTTHPTPEAVARVLLETFPLMGRLMATRMRESGEEEATLMQIGVLIRIRESPTPVTASDLAKTRRVSLQSASVLVQSLVDRGWLTRVPNPKDRRQFILQVTPEGAIRADAMQQQFMDLITTLFSDLSTEELDAASIFLPALHRLVIEQLHDDDVTELQS